MSTRNRGKKSNDDKIFATRWHSVFKEAVDDFCYLLSRGYTEKTASQVVGNRYKLNKRQRIAINRISASSQQVKKRKESECNIAKLKNNPIEIDGFNLLILIESALSGGYIFKGRDSTYRDLSSVHGSYKRVVKTNVALLLIGQVLKSLEVGSVKWYLDRPVSNSGRLRSVLLEISEENGFGWSVSLVNNPDKILARSKAVAVTSDSWILDRVSHWFNLGDYIISKKIPDAPVIMV